MNSQERRKQIQNMLTEAKNPISGTEIAQRLGVSRQIIVQDIALMRAEELDIISTYKGYIMSDSNTGDEMKKRVFAVSHSTDQVLDEFYSVVDFGGQVLDISVEHDIYGTITVDLIIKNRMDARDFDSKLRDSKDKPLKVLTGDIHFHTVAAETEEILDMIEEEFRKIGILVEI